MKAVGVEARIPDACGLEAGWQSRPGHLAMDEPEIDRIVVERVYDKCHCHIIRAIRGFSLPAEFLGALTANESSGNPNATCFEARVYGRLKAVANGQLPAFGSIGQKQLSSALQEDMALREDLTEALTVTQGSRDGMAKQAAEQQDRGLRELSTSWGFTQIMGYHVIGRKARIQALLDPQFHFQFAVELLTEFARQFHLRLSCDFEPLFRCWNTGRPDGNTFNPAYVAMGMRRMPVYRQIMNQMPDGPGTRGT